MRYDEWIFPIRKYVRLRHEVGGAAVFLTWLVAVVLVSAALLVPAFFQYAALSASRARWRGVRMMARPGDDWVTRACGIVQGFFSTHASQIYWYVVSAVVLLAIITAVELAASLAFVRKRPGRRRPVCTRQTFKYVVLGSRVWVIFTWVWLGIGALIAWFGSAMGSGGADVVFLTVILTNGTKLSM